MLLRFNNSNERNDPIKEFPVADNFGGVQLYPGTRGAQLGNYAVTIIQISLDM